MQILTNTSVNAFGYVGHYIIGETVQHLLPISTLNKINAHGYLDQFNGSLGKLSLWADKIKYDKQYQWTRPMHYYDIDSDPPLNCPKFTFPENNNNETNLLYALKTFLLDLEESNQHSVGAATKIIHKFSFNMLIHLLQDLYQPLHFTAKGRGGNEYWFEYKNKRYNLHYFWDSVVLRWALQDILGKSYTMNEAILYFVNKFDKQIDCKFVKFINDVNPIDINSSDQIIFQNENLDETKDLDDIEEFFINIANFVSKENCNLIWHYNEDIDDYVELSKSKIEKLLSYSIKTSYCILQKIF